MRFNQPWLVPFHEATGRLLLRHGECWSLPALEAQHRHEAIADQRVEARYICSGEATGQAFDGLELTERGRTALAASKVFIHPPSEALVELAVEIRRQEFDDLDAR
jgi:hypothetical protein